MLSQEKAHVFSELQASILRMEGFKSVSHPAMDGGLGDILKSFPNATFPLGCMHEFISTTKENTAATSGFVSGLLSLLMKESGTCLWISSSGTHFPPAFRQFGMTPDHILFLDLKHDHEVLEAMDEALRCPALNAVICEVKELSFKNSRRFQLATEGSAVTGFILRETTRKIDATACVSRWKIQSMPSVAIDGLPGVGMPSWKVDLLKIRNGTPGNWNIQWKDGKFVPISQSPNTLRISTRQMG